MDASIFIHPIENGGDLGWIRTSRPSA